MSNQIGISINNNAEVLYGAPNKKRGFRLNVHNYESYFLPQVKVTLTGPAEVRILKTTRSYGSIGIGQTKTQTFAIIPLTKGNFNLTATLESKGTVLLSYPIKFRVGTTYAQQKPVVHPFQRQHVRPDNIIKIECPFCHAAISKNAKFCPNCGSDVTKIKEQKLGKTCPSCGEEDLPRDAKFCPICGETQ
jgi:RNA polymerase subunit RPABC4/transcription elongation factor Spt4